jgi:hypothetical protein
VKALVTQHWIEIDVAMLLAELHFGLVLLRNRQALSDSMYIVITIYNIPIQHCNCSPNKKGPLPIASQTTLMAGIAWLGFQVHHGEVPRSWCFCQCLGGHAEQEIWPLAQSQQSDMAVCQNLVPLVNIKIKPCTPGEHQNSW